MQTFRKLHGRSRSLLFLIMISLSFCFRLVFRWSWLVSDKFLFLFKMFHILRPRKLHYKPVLFNEVADENTVPVFIGQTPFLLTIHIENVGIL